MPKASPTQDSFNAGEWSPRLKGRADIAKYKSATQTMENFIPLVQGPARKRPGTRFVAETKHSSAFAARLIPFEFNTAQAYVLEFGHDYIWVYKDGGLVLETGTDKTISAATQADPVAITTSTTHGYSNNDRVFITGAGGMDEINGRFFRITVTSTTEFTLADMNGNGIDGTGYTAFTSGGTSQVVYDVTTTYESTDVPGIDFAQSGDVVYLVHPDFPPAKLSRTDHDAWTLNDVVFEWYPFQDENITATTMQASAATGAITITASVATFDVNYVGKRMAFNEVLASKYDEWATSTAITTGDFRHFSGNLYKATSTATTGTRPPIHLEGSESDGGVTWEYQHSGQGYARITSVGNTTLVNAVVEQTIPDSGVSSATTRWALSHWGGGDGFPSTVAFYEDRLWYGGSPGFPQTLWGSTTGGYDNFQAGTVDSDAVTYTIASQNLNSIEWMVPGRVLAVGTSGGEFLVQASSLDEAITPTNVKIVPHTTYGSNTVRPVRIGNAVLFTQRSGKKVREFAYSIEKDGFVAPDMTTLSEHLMDGGLTELAWQQEPEQIIWFIRADGVLLGFTYERAEDVVAWHQHDVGGTVESITSIPHWDGDQDCLWMIVNRTINGSTVRYVEYFAKYDITASGVYSDCSLTYSGVAAQSIGGLFHLEGEEVSITVKGAVHPNATVNNGQVTLQNSTADNDVVVIGTPYTATLKTMPIEAGAADGTAQGKIKRLTNVTFRLLETGPGLYYGPTTTNMDLMMSRSSNHAMDAAVPLLTGDSPLLAWPGGYDTQGEVVIQHRTPLPCTVVAVMPQVVTSDR